MASTFQDRYTAHRFSFSDALGRLVTVYVSARQRQAEERVAAYLRGLPDHVIRKLGGSPADMEKLRHSGEAHPPGLYGRVSAVSVLRSVRN